MQGRAIVIGGSIGGLFAAALLRTKGWEVDVYERVDVELSGRGAGIVTHAPLLEALEKSGAGTEGLGVVSKRRVAYGPAGEVLRDFEFPQLVTSWDRLHSLTRATIPDGRYHLGHHLDRYDAHPDGVRVRFLNGAEAEADLLVGADGFRSAVRAQLFPEVVPEYAGYVVWRGVAPEADLPEDVRRDFFGNFAFNLPEGDGEAIGYPIAGTDNDVRPGHRRYNWVWYRVVRPDDLTDLLTDADGTTYTISIPPPLIRPEVIERLRREASATLAPHFARTLECVEMPFFTPIYDHASPSLIGDRTALVGDAGFVARPHIGAGVTKAAQDAMALADALSGVQDVAAGLAAYDTARLEMNRIAHERGRHMGEYLMPAWRTEDERADWTAHHNIDTIMRDTAVMNYY